MHSFSSPYFKFALFLSLYSEFPSQMCPFLNLYSGFWIHSLELNEYLFQIVLVIWMGSFLNFYLKGIGLKIYPEYRRFLNPEFILLLHNPERLTFNVLIS